jgi:N-carbamoyl-L-amino-acid hydrolase
MSTMKVNSERLNRSLNELGKIGETAHGMHRIAFSAAELEARKHVTARMRETGLEVEVDAAGNIIGRRAGSEPGLPPILLGSHIDTVPSGGKYDGALGMMAAIEVCRTLDDRGHTTRHPLEIIAFTNEEGARFRRGLQGSRAMGGLLEPADLEAMDDEGKTLADWLPEVGGDAKRLDEAIRKRGSAAAYLELHIEQGPHLERMGTPVAVVTGITGRMVCRVTVRGSANHAGTTPMDGRSDALVAASMVVLAVQEISGIEELCRVSTVGVVHAKPNAVNVIPGEVKMEVELRDLAMERMEAAEERLRERCAEIAGHEGLEIDVERREVEHATPTHPALMEFIATAAADLDLESTELPSGAGHDAQSVARFTDVGMIFVPSKDGVSHSPREYTSPEDCTNGANVLLNAMLRADETLGCR